MLAAQIDGRRHRARQLPHACHAAVKRDARAPIGAHAAHGHQLIFVFTQLTAIRGRAGKPEETPADLQAILAIPHGILVRAGAHEQLERRQQRRFAGARLAREHGQALRGDKGGLLYQRQVLNLHLVDHGGSFCVRIMRPQHVRLFYMAQYTSLAAQQARTWRLFGASDISRQETSPCPRNLAHPSPLKGELAPQACRRVLLAALVGLRAAAMPPLHKECHAVHSVALAQQLDLRVEAFIFHKP